VANQQHVDALTRSGVRLWNLWREDEPQTRPDLRGADLSGANLSKANLSHANLREANLSHANLGGAGLGYANLSKADLNWTQLSGADLMSADLFEAQLFEANLSEADLWGADLGRANLRGADLSGAVLFDANFSYADLTGANLTGASCLKTTFCEATLTGCSVYGISAWDVNLDGAKQEDLRITPLQDMTRITVDNLEVAQFLYVLMTNQKVRAVLDTITSKVVLILGRFSDERKPVLDAVREALRSHPNGYIPVLFDFEPQPDKPVLETVKTLANLARFVIADLTDPHMVRSELTYIVPNVPTVPVQPIMQRDARLPPEYGTWELYNSFLPVYEYADLSHLLANLTDDVIAPVETRVHARSLADANNK
jgi:hypothetical protein